MKIGKNQQSFLDAMHDHGDTYYPGCGWTWGCRSESLRLAASLKVKGLVVEHKPGHFRLTDAGLKQARPNLKEILAARANGNK